VKTGADTGGPAELRARAVATARRLRRRIAGAPEPPAALTTADVLRLVEDLATQLRAGAAPHTAWRAAVELLPHAADVHRPREAVERLASVAGAPVALQALNAAWSLSEDVGAPLADVLQTVAAAIRQDADVEADIDAALAAPRATARLLAVLPLAGLGLGELIGARPLDMLLHTAIGRACAVLGLALMLAGQWWTRRLVTRTAALL
jgi:tight adherence protein B